MKKLIYSLAAASLCLTGCLDLEDESSESYPDGPAVSVEIKAAEAGSVAYTITTSQDVASMAYALIEGAPETVSEDDILDTKGVTFVHVTGGDVVTATVSSLSAGKSYTIAAIGYNQYNKAGAVAFASTTGSAVTLDGFYKGYVVVPGKSTIKVVYGSTVSAGSLSATLKTADKTVALTGTLTGTTLTFSIPDDLAAGTTFSVTIDEGAVLDPNGASMPAKEAGSDLMIGYAYDKSVVLGYKESTFKSNLYGTDYDWYSGWTIAEGKATGTEDDYEVTVSISGMAEGLYYDTDKAGWYTYLDDKSDKAVTGTFDSMLGTLTIESWQVIGTYGTYYTTYIYDTETEGYDDNNNVSSIVATVSKDGSLSVPSITWYYYYNSEYSGTLATLDATTMVNGTKEEGGDTEGGKEEGGDEGGDTESPLQAILGTYTGTVTDVWKTEFSMSVTISAYSGDDTKVYIDGLDPQMVAWTYTDHFYGTVDEGLTTISVPVYQSYAGYSTAILYGLSSADPNDDSATALEEGESIVLAISNEGKTITVQNSFYCYIGSTCYSYYPGNIVLTKSE